MYVFKKNIHLAKKMTVAEVEKLIQNYNGRYPPPKYMLFMRNMLREGWRVKLYTSKVSKYVFVTKPKHAYKIRFSNHKPTYTRESNGDSDYYVGVSNFAVHTAEEIENLLNHKANTN